MRKEVVGQSEGRYTTNVSLKLTKTGRHFISSPLEQSAGYLLEAIEGVFFDIFGSFENEFNAFETFDASFPARL